MTANETTQTVRRLLRVSGVLLWVAAFVGIYFLWQSSSKTPPSPTPQKKITLKPSWNSGGLEDFELIERSGKKVTKADLLGRPWAVCFIFTRCAGPCPRVTAQMKKLHDQLVETDIRFLTLTVDPKYDTVEVLSRYANAVGADPNRWLFLTGDQQEIYHLIQQSFKLPVQEILGKDREPGFEVVHSTNILHMNAQARVIGKYNAMNDTEIVRLRRALLGEVHPNSEDE